MALSYHIIVPFISKLRKYCSLVRTLAIALPTIAGMFVYQKSVLSLTHPNFFTVAIRAIMKNRFQALLLDPPPPPHPPDGKKSDRFQFQRFKGKMYP